MGKNDLSRTESAKAVLYIIGSARQTIDLEYFSVCCFKAFPRQYSYDMYPEYPRYDRASKNLGKIVADGFAKYVDTNKTQVTVCKKAALSWVDENTDLIRSAAEGLGNLSPEFQIIGSGEARREIAKLKRSAAYKKTQQNQDLTMSDYLDFLQLDTYVTENIFRRKWRKVFMVTEQDDELKELFTRLTALYGTDYYIFKQNLQNLMRERK